MQEKVLDKYYAIMLNMPGLIPEVLFGISNLAADSQEHMEEIVRNDVFNKVVDLMLSSSI